MSLPDPLPEPLTPDDCDLQDFPFMPLHVARLRDSDLAAEEEPEACWYAVLLWSAAWHQIPAGSLPDNEAVLARLCGLGRDLRTFRKHKAGAMRGFIRCSDGRLYHPIVAEQAIAAWESKKQQRWRSECARIKKANQRNGTSIAAPTYEEFVASMSGETAAPCPASVPGDNAACPPGQTLQGTGTGTGIDIDPPTPQGGRRRKPEKPLPADCPSADAIAAMQAEAREVGANLDLAHEARQFRDWWTAKDGRNRDWDACWRTWARRAIARAPRTATAALTARRTAPEADRWRKLVREFRANGYWPSDDAGPAPSRPGCRAPTEVLAEFGFTPQPANDTPLFAQPGAAA